MSDSPSDPKHSLGVDRRGFLKRAGAAGAAVIASRLGGPGAASAQDATAVLRPARDLQSPAVLPRACRLWGDFIGQSALWTRFVPASQRYAEALRADGGVADWRELPKLGVTGNGHMLMMDKNSDQVAQLIQKWLADNKLMQ